MDSNSYKTASANSKNVEKKWVVVDATDQILGRLSSKVAKLLRGKHKPSFTPHVDCGDNVIVINANKISLSGKKWSSKQYVRYTGYPGGQRFETAQSIFDKNPSKLLKNQSKECFLRISLDLYFLGI